MKKVQGNDSFQRINYLYQASKHMISINPALASYYGNLMVNVAKKNVLKIHPEIKRQFCKKCRCVLIKKVSANVNIKDNGRVLERNCKKCKTKKALPTNKEKDHRVWVEKTESVVEIIQ